MGVYFCKVVLISFLPNCLIKDFPCQKLFKYKELWTFCGPPSFSYHKWLFLMILFLSSWGTAFWGPNYCILQCFRPQLFVNKLGLDLMSFVYFKDSNRIHSLNHILVLLLPENLLLGNPLTVWSTYLDLIWFKVWTFKKCKLIKIIFPTFILFMIKSETYLLYCLI